MTREDRDKLLIYLTEKTNNDVTDCRLRIAKEDGRIEGLQMAAEQFARYVRDQIESEEAKRKCKEPSLWWKIWKILGEPPKPFNPAESENKG